MRKSLGVNCTQFRLTPELAHYLSALVYKFYTWNHIMAQVSPVIFQTTTGEKTLSVALVSEL